jgi:hypothetical protein
MVVDCFSNKKGVARMTETILVLFFVVVLISAVMIVYYKINIGNIKERGFELSEEGASVLLNSITRMAEVSCNNEDCLDIVKILAFREVSKRQASYYRSIFGNKKIFVERLYPESLEKECEVNDFNSNVFPGNCNKITIYEEVPESYNSKAIVSSPVSLWYDVHGAHSLGRITIEVYK